MISDSGSSDTKLRSLPASIARRYSCAQSCGGIALVDPGGIAAEMTSSERRLAVVAPAVVHESAVVGGRLAEKTRARVLLDGGDLLVPILVAAKESLEECEPRHRGARIVRKRVGVAGAVLGCMGLGRNARGVDLDEDVREGDTVWCVAKEPRLKDSVGCEPQYARHVVRLELQWLRRLAVRLPHRETGVSLDTNRQIGIPLHLEGPACLAVEVDRTVAVDRVSDRLEVIDEHAGELDVVPAAKTLGPARHSDARRILLGEFLE